MSLYHFIHQLQYHDLPDAVIQQARRCLIDLIGTAAGGSTLDSSVIIRRHVTAQYAAGSDSARILLDGRRVSPIGAALAGGTTIDALDCHDGHVLVKGHVGVAILPALLALAETCIMDGREFLTTFALGYEIATRAGIALHSTASDYHSSGAWNALACAAIAARLLSLTDIQTRHALGIAEYNGPRSQIMRVVDNPTMIKDGSGWGTMTGLSAAYLARDGFTGAPALTIETQRVAPIWEDLGERWLILDQYFKPYPVCRWAQPAIEAALKLQRQLGITADGIEYITVSTFHEGTRLATRCPQTTDEAQYSLPFPLAAALVYGHVGAKEVSEAVLLEPEILRLSTEMQLDEDAVYNAKFPAERWAHVSFHLRDGSTHTSAPTIARGNPENPLSDDEIAQKYWLLAEPVLGGDRAARIAEGVKNLPDIDLSEWLDLLY